MVPTFKLQDRGGLDMTSDGGPDQLLGMAMNNPKLIAVRPNGQDDSRSSSSISMMCGQGRWGVP